MGERKRSWREIDRMRDRPFERRETKSRLEKALEDPRLKKQYLKEAERLFMGPKGRPEHERDLLALKESYGTERFEEEARRYVETYGMPDEWGTLIMLLDLKRETGILIQAMEEAERRAPEMSPIERQGLVSKLRILSLSSKDPDISEAAQEVLDGLES